MDRKSIVSNGLRTDIFGIGKAVERGLVVYI